MSEISSQKKLDDSKSITIGIIMAKVARVADWLNEKWIVKIIFSSLPVVWTICIQPLLKLGYYNPDGSINKQILACAVLICLFSGLVLVLTDYKTRRDKKRYKYNEQLFEISKSEIRLRASVTSAECELEDRRRTQLVDYYENKKIEDSVKRFVADARNPRISLNYTLGRIGNCLSNVTILNPENIYISAAMRIEMKKTKKKGAKIIDDWTWISRPPLEGTPEISVLLKHPSLFRQVANKEKTFIYENDKKKAIEEGTYFADGRDSTNDNIGSIIVWEVSEQMGKYTLRLIISVSTYGKKIVENEKKYITDNVVKDVYENKFRDIIINQFDGELKEDIVWYGLSILHDNV